MTTLYKLADSYREAVTNLMELAEAGEIDENALQDTLEGVQGEVTDKVLNVAMHVKNLRSDLSQHEIAIKEFQDKAKSIKNSIAFFENYLDNNMQKAGIDEAKNEYAEVKCRKLPDTVDIIGLVSPEYERVVPEKREPDKVSIKKALNEGQNLAFACLITGRKGLQIK